MMKSSLFEWLALTATERKVIFFLVGAFVIGLGIRLYQQTFPPLRTFDYSASDSTFAALSSVEQEEAAEERPAAASGPTNINTATKSELVRLPGIGEVTAGHILLYREKVGLFKTIEDLRNVKGISKLKLEKLKPLVAVH
jgi:competence ComEA-like helix-hairpin-helix protein